MAVSPTAGTWKNEDEEEVLSSITKIFSGHITTHYSQVELGNLIRSANKKSASSHKSPAR